MTIQLTSIKPTLQILPPRIVLYGPEKIGKSTFASEIEGALYNDFEEGSGRLNVRRAPGEWKNSFANVVATARALHTQQHDYSAVIYDTADWLEMVIHRQVAAPSTPARKASRTSATGAPDTRVAVNLWKQLLDEADACVPQVGLPVVVRFAINPDQTIR